MDLSLNYRTALVRILILYVYNCIINIPGTDFLHRRYIDSIIIVKTYVVSLHLLIK